MEREALEVNAEAAGASVEAGEQQNVINPKKSFLIVNNKGWFGENPPPSPGPSDPPPRWPTA